MKASAWAATLVALVVGIGIGCEVAQTASASDVACTCEPKGQPVDAALMAFLSKAKAAHRDADIAEQQGDRARAVAALERLSRGPRPTGRPEADEVSADTKARLAELRAALGQLDLAEGDVREGLDLARDASYFRGHLFEVLGAVEEKRALLLEKTDTAAAAEARKRALAASEKAIEIQDAVLNSALQRARDGK